MRRCPWLEREAGVILDDLDRSASVRHILHEPVHLRRGLLGLGGQLAELEERTLDRGIGLRCVSPLAFLADIVAVLFRRAVRRFNMGGRKPAFDRAEPDRRVPEQESVRMICAGWRDLVGHTEIPRMEQVYAVDDHVVVDTVFQRIVDGEYIFSRL